MTNISQKMIGGLELLVPFTYDYTQKLHASGLSKLLSLPQKTVSRKMESLAKLNLLGFKRVGRNKYYFLNLDTISSFSLLQIIENYKVVNFFVDNPKLSSFFNELGLKRSFILFGSYAKNRAKNSSDIDLVIFGKESKDINSIIQRYPFEINPHFFTLSHFKKMLNQPFGKEIVKNHILFGETEKVIKMFMGN